MTIRKPMLILNRAGSPIFTWEDWTRPKKEDHWEEGRSAMELAKAWFRGSTAECPVELDTLLRSAPFLEGLRLLEGRPEFVTSLPMAGEGRNHDLYIRADSADGKISICVEAKADEPFGNTLLDEFAKARKRNPGTRVHIRARRLIQILTGTDVNPEKSPWKYLRYQLLTGLSGTALQASRDGAKMGVFIVHEFVTHKTRYELHARNWDDLAVFLRALSATLPSLGPGRFWGPLETYTAPSINLYVAKIVTNLTQCLP